MEKDKYIIKICEYPSLPYDRSPFFIKRKKRGWFSSWKTIRAFNGEKKAAVRFSSYRDALDFCDTYDVFNAEDIIVSDKEWRLTSSAIITNPVCKGVL